MKWKEEKNSQWYNKFILDRHVFNGIQFLRIVYI